MKVTLTRFGSKRRLVLMFEWLTLWPTCGPLAVSSQRRDMSKSSSIPAMAKPLLAGAAGVQNRVHFQEPRTYRGRRPAGQGFWAGLNRVFAGFIRCSSHLGHHIKGAFAADTMG